MYDHTIIYKSYNGSLLYGTSNESSDVDITGLFIPGYKNILLNPANEKIKFYDASYIVKDKNGHNTKDSVDEKYYNVIVFINYLVKGSPVLFEILYTPSEFVITKNDYLFEPILKNKNLFISKSILKGFLGLYNNAKKKLESKTTIRNLKIMDAYEALLDIIKRNNVKKVMDLLKYENEIVSLHNENKKYIMKNEHKIFNKTTFTFFSISSIVTNDIDDVICSLKKIISLKENYIREHNKYLYNMKRVLYEAEELIVNGEIKFPLNQKNELKKIKYCEDLIDLKMFIEECDELYSFVDNTIANSKSIPLKIDLQKVNKIKSDIINRFLNIS